MNDALTQTIWPFHHLEHQRVTRPVFLGTFLRKCR